ncbi:TIGR03089 family protein [Actinomyces radicidentis]|uniref:TIGR03089 family protein n=1 Tax=Actinomyces radicidentis TaxID=111015 RepID=UPI0026E0D570|nr:TIGR03089 family protein [Actinomyces radicidentis]
MTDALATILPQHSDADRPWLVWYAPGERVEFSGHVLAMWEAKTAGFITVESRPGAPVHVGLPVHWRTVTWCAGAWAAGSPVLLTDGPTADSLVEAGAEPAGLSVAMDAALLSEEADAQALVPAASLAVRWPGELPPLVLDGLADLMVHPDSFSGPAVPGSAAAVLEAAEGAARPLSRDELAEGLRPITVRPCARAVTVRESEPLEAVRGALAAWRAGLTAVLLSPDADDALAATAARQEGADV